MIISVSNEWSDDYWLLLMQLYLRKPIGAETLCSRAMVDLCLELHMPPQTLYKQMFRLRRLDTSCLGKLWNECAEHPNKLACGVELLRKMREFGQTVSFYDGVEMNESLEHDPKPLAAGAELTLIILIIILGPYFRLVLITMIAGTPGVVSLAKLMRLKLGKIVEVVTVFRFRDPYLNRDDTMIHLLLAPCQDIRQRYGNASPERLAALAAQPKGYLKD